MWAGGLVTLIPTQVSSSVSLHQLGLSKEIIFLIVAVPATTKGLKQLKRARDESTSDDDQWHQGWRQLGDDNKWKRFGDYWRKQDADKTCNHCSITFSYEERGRKDPQYCLPLVPETNNKIIVRECYKDLYNYIFTLRGHKYTGLILTGQPGTGASLL
jgi:hypothetical protein